MEILLSAVTESKPKVTYHIRPKPYVPPKVMRDFRPKTETESQSYLSRHAIEASKSHPVSVAQLSRASDIFHIYPIMSAVRRVINDTATRPHSTRCRRRQRSRFLGIVSTQGNSSPRLAHSGLRNSSSVTYFRQPPNLPTAARRNRKCTECDTTAFGRNQMSAESAHLSTFGAETEAEIRSTSRD